MLCWGVCAVCCVMCDVKLCVLWTVHLDFSQEVRGSGCVCWGVLCVIRLCCDARRVNLDFSQDERCVFWGGGRGCFRSVVGAGVFCGRVLCVG